MVSMTFFHAGALRASAQTHWAMGMDLCVSCTSTLLPLARSVLSWQSTWCLRQGLWVWVTPGPGPTTRLEHSRCCVPRLRTPS